MKIFLLLALIVLLLSHIRNEMVYLYRQNIIKKIFDPENEYRFERLVEMHNSVSYDEMVWKFWRSFDSFYPDEMK